MTLSMFLLPLSIGVLFLLGFTLKKLISEFLIKGKTNPTHLKLFIIALLGIWFFFSLYLLLNAWLGHSETAKSLVKWKCLLAFSSIVLLPSAFLFLLRDYLAQRHREISSWRRKSVFIIAIMIMLIVFSAGKSGAWPPLSFAMRNGWTNIAHLLIQTRITLDERDADDLSPLEYAAIRDDIITIKFLLKNGAQLHGNKNPGAAALWQACFRGHRDVAELLIDRGVDVNTIFELGAYDGWTPLMVAAERGYFDIVKMLVKKGGDASIVEKAGNMAAIIANKNGHKEIFKFLADL